MVASLGPLFVAGAAATATTAATVGGLTAMGTAVMGIAGSVITGAASAYMSQKDKKDAEQERIREEERRQANYAGIGDAVDFSKPEADDTELLGADIMSAPKLGAPPPPPDRMGDIYKQRAQEKRERRTPRFQYNRDQGLIEQL